MLFTFPSRYWFAIGLSRVFSLAGWSPLFHAEFLVFRATQDTAWLRGASDTRLSLSVVQLSNCFSSPLFMPIWQSYNPNEAGTSLVWALARSLATTCAIIRLFSLPQGTKMFQFPWFASSIMMMTCLQHAGLSHSEIRGSRVICTYPRLFAAYHVLHRL